MSVHLLFLLLMRPWIVFALRGMVVHEGARPGRLRPAAFLSRLPAARRDRPRRSGIARGEAGSPAAKRDRPRRSGIAARL
jgi:hypothetical protein